MVTKKVLLKFDMELETEQRGSYFAARTKPFAITAYGNTDVEAEERALQAVRFLIDTHSKTLGEIRGFLTHRGVKHVVREDAKEMMPSHSVVRSSRREMGVEVFAGV